VDNWVILLDIVEGLDQSQGVGVGDGIEIEVGVERGGGGGLGLDRIGRGEEGLGRGGTGGTEGTGSLIGRKEVEGILGRFLLEGDQYLHIFIFF
jgi:hypothetical protein